MYNRVLAGRGKMLGAERTGTFGTVNIFGALFRIVSNVATRFCWSGLPVPDLYSVCWWTSRL